MSYEQAMREIRHLRTVNATLLEALEEVMDWSQYDHATCTTTATRCWCHKARAAIRAGKEI